MLLAVVPLAVSGAVAAAPVYFAGTDNYYEAVVIRNSWTEASTAAESLSYLGRPGRLATITSEAENDFLVASVLPVTEMGFWLGARQVQPYQSGTWAWITGEPWAFANWDVGEPNNASAPEDCLQIYSDWSGYPLPERRLPGKWNDVHETANGYKSGGYVIEYAAVPEPASFTLAGLCAFVVAGRRRT